MRIAPGSCPGGLVAIAYNDVGIQRGQQVTLGAHGRDAGMAEAAVMHAATVREHGGYVIVYDGDSGRPVIQVLADDVIVLPRQ